MKNWYSVVLIASLAILVALSACSEDSPSEDISFDRQAMLQSLADGLIIPNLESLNQSVADLEEAVSNFNERGTGEDMANLRFAWEVAVTDFQHCTAFGFGPGGLSLGSFPSVLGVFPVDESQVELNITDPSFNLSATFDRDVRGFYTVEYLIFGNGKTDAEVLASFDEERMAYLSLIVGELKETFSEILKEWNISYRAEFIANDGTAAGSSVSLLYNEFVKDYENLKNFKVELPAGLTAGQTSAEPRLVEAYYSGISTSLIEEHFESSKNIWVGQARDGKPLTGFDEYLKAVVGGPELVVQTESAIADIDTAIENLPTLLSQGVDATEVETLRDLLQANTPNFKSSMSSLLGISITFNSGDGD